MGHKLQKVVEGVSMATMKANIDLVRDTKKKLYACTTAGLFFLLLPVVLIAIDPMLIIGKYNFRLENGTILHEILSEELECGHFEVFLFNITNAEAFMAGKDYTLKLEEIGPFTYLEYRLNKDLELKDGVMRYTPILRSVFVSEESIGYPEDINITMPNIPMLSASTLLSSSPFLVKSVFNIMVAQLGSKAIVSKSAYDYIWGYHEPVLSFANKIVPGLIHFETTGIMDRLYDKNSFYRLELGATDMDKFSVKNVKHFKIITSGEHESITESTVNFTDTYEGIAYPPLLQPDTPINIYRVGICKSFGMTVCGTTTSEYGPQAFVYKMSEDQYTNRSLCNSRGFCPVGLMDMSPCYYGIPLAISKGHFLDGDPELYDRVEGLKPDKMIHDSHLIIEPKIGLTLETHMSLQVNIVLGNLNYSSAARRFTDIVLPIAHFQIKQPKLPDIAIRALRLMYITMPKIFLVVQIILFITGFICLCYSLKLLFILYVLNKTTKDISEISSTLDKNCNSKAQIPLILK